MEYQLPAAEEKMAKQALVFPPDSFTVTIAKQRATMKVVSQTDKNF